MWRMIMRAFVLLLLSTLPAKAGDIITSAIADLQAGVICAPEVIDHVPAPDTVAGVQNVIEGDPPFVTNGRTVPAVIGIGFAIKAQAAGQDLPEVTIVVTHPPMGPDGVTRESYQTSIRADRLSLTAWQFEHEYELVTGPWTVSAWAGDRLVYAVTFDVVPPEMLPELAATCGFEELLS